MTPLDNSVYKTLNLLVMLSRDRKILFPNLSEEEQATLTVTKQILTDAGLTVPEFTNSLHEIFKRGYVWHSVFYDEKIRAQLDALLSDSTKYEEAMEQLKVLDTKEFSDKMKAAIEKDFIAMLPQGTEMQHTESNLEDLTFTDTLKDGLEIYKKLSPEEIGLVILMPFRDINKLFSRIGNGEKFAAIIDDGFWYDQNSFIFNIDGTGIDLSHHGMPTMAHFVLNEMFSSPVLKEIEYEKMVGFDPSKGNEAYQDAMRKFVKKHPKLKLLFTVRKYNTEFHPDRYTGTP